MAHARFVQHSKRQLSIPGLSPAQPAAAQPAATTAPAAQAAATPAPVANPKTDPQPVAAQPGQSRSRSAAVQRRTMPLRRFWHTPARRRRFLATRRRAKFPCSPTPAGTSFRTAYRTRSGPIRAPRASRLAGAWQTPAATPSRREPALTNSSPSSVRRPSLARCRPAHHLGSSRRRPGGYRASRALCCSSTDLELHRPQQQRRWSWSAQQPLRVYRRRRAYPLRRSRCPLRG